MVWPRRDLDGPAANLPMQGALINIFSNNKIYLPTMQSAVRFIPGGRTGFGYHVTYFGDFPSGMFFLHCGNLVEADRSM